MEEKDLKTKIFDDVTKDVIEELESRQDNLKIYYPYFEIVRKLKAKQNTFEVNLTGVLIAMLSFLLYEGKLNSRKVEYEDICEFIQYFIEKIYSKKYKKSDIKEIVNVVLDEIQNKGNNFIFSHYDFKNKKMKEKYLKYIEIKIDENGKLNYYITTQGIDFYLKTKEFPDAAQITINLLLFRKQIEKGSFEYAYDTVKRLNIEVKRKIEQKENVIEGLMYGGKEGIFQYYKYHESVKNQFEEEEELFGDVSIIIKNLYTEYLQKENLDKLDAKEKRTIAIIRKIEQELNKAIYNHTKLLQEASSMHKKYDDIINMKMKNAFSEKFGFEKEFEKLVEKTNNAEKLKYFIFPFLLPKMIKSFNPMKSLESQRIYQEFKEEEIIEKNEIKEIETIDKITQKRVIHNFKFYFKNLLILLDNNHRTTLQELAKFIKENYEDKYLYNGDFISFVIYLNRKKVFSKDEDEIFSEFDFNKLIIHPTKDDIDLENGLKITNIIFEIEKGR